MVAIMLLVMTPAALLAQSEGSINTYSPYSMYGLGELSTPGTLITRSMGGAGVAMRSATDVNLLNPAAYSATLNRSVLFSYGMEASNYFNTQTVNGSSSSNAYASGNIHDIAIQLPLAKDIGLGISITPYSSSGYLISTTENMTDIGLIGYAYEGSGDLTEVKVGAGWRLHKSLSVGLAVQYYWGALERSFTVTPYSVTGDGVYYSTQGETNYVISRLKAQAGIQWSPISDTRRNLTFGAVYDFGGDLCPSYEHYVLGTGTLLSIVATSIEETVSLVLPNQLTLGATYQTPKVVMSVDYNYQNWGSNNDGTVETTSSGVTVSYNDFSTFKMGLQWTPNRNDARNYFRRVSYRGGLRYGGYQQTFDGEQIEQLAITAGAGFPLKRGGMSKIDVGLEYGSRGSSSVTFGSDSSNSLIRQNYIKIALGFSFFGEDYWFQRPKFD